MLDNRRDFILHQVKNLKEILQILDQNPEMREINPPLVDNFIQVA